MTNFSKICVVGLGYIGLPTAAMFAIRGIEVVGVDVNPDTVATINAGDIHIVEPDLDAAVREAVCQGHLRATLTPEPADAFLVAVPTPFHGSNHTPNLNFIQAAAKAISPQLRRGTLVVLESTGPVGATEKMVEWLVEARPDLTFPPTAGESSDILVAYCPERVLPGKVMQELITNDRIIGGMTSASSARAAALYREFVTGDCVIASGSSVAEMAKLAENSFRDVNIAFANELSVICDGLDIDVWELIRLTNHHPRVNILQPGPGVGGHCIAVDPWFIVASAPKEARLIRTARQVNDAKPAWVLEKTQACLGAFLNAHPNKTAADVTVAVYGLSFKPDIDDLRESPALEIARKLVNQIAGPLLISEPHIDSLPAGLERAVLTNTDAAAKADLHVFLVAHTAFRQIIPPTFSVLATQIVPAST